MWQQRLACQVRADEKCEEGEGPGNPGPRKLNDQCLTQVGFGLFLAKTLLPIGPTSRLQKHKPYCCFDVPTCYFLTLKRERNNWANPSHQTVNKVNTSTHSSCKEVEPASVVSMVAQTVKLMGAGHFRTWRPLLHIKYKFSLIIFSWSYLII